MQQKFREAEENFRAKKQEVHESIAAVIDERLGPLEEEAMDIEEKLEVLYAREHDLQSELSTFSREIAPLRQNVESSMLDMLDTAIRAAQSNPIVFANDGE